MRLLCCGRPAALTLGSRAPWRASTLGSRAQVRALAPLTCLALTALLSAGCGIDRSASGEASTTIVDPIDGASDASGVTARDAGRLDSGVAPDATRDAAPPTPEAAILACKRAGTLALRVDAQVSWKGSTLFDIVPIITPGFGGLSVLVLAEISEQNGEYSTEIRACNTRTPDFSSSVGETYGVVSPDEIWDEVAARWSAGVDFACDQPGCAVDATPIIAQLGLKIPERQSWPTARDPLDVATLTDDDDDGVPGILFRARGPKDPGAVKYTHPPVNYLLTERISDLMLALRIGAQISGQFDTCDSLSGSVPDMTIDTRALACRLESGDRCSPDQVGFLDDNLPVWQVNSTSFQAVRVADGASCADARMAMP